ncbi:MAG: large-conductance mechanosensitive channel protein MscL [Clostridia bacterium]|nr:large-conductance mechanosensitive channel protein MscL [Clostridia bacterium]
MKKFLADFKAFAVKGNVIDMAVGVIIGGAFGKIVTSVVNDLIMPAVSMLTGGVDFSDWKWVLKEAVLDEAGAEVAAAVTVNYGNLIAIIVDFLIIALSVFFFVRLIKNMEDGAKKRRSKKNPQPEAPAPAPEPPKKSDEVLLLEEIRDLLKK